MPLHSLWQDRHDVLVTRAGHEPSSSVDGDWDVVVVGAGITGLSTAARLGRAGLSVLVVEARRIGCGTTGGSTAKISLLQGTRLSQIARHQSDPILRDYVAANLEAQAWVTHFCEANGVEIQSRPAYTYATTAEDEHAIRHEQELAVRAGLPVTWLDDVPLPFPTRGAITLPDQRQVDPVALLQALAADAVSHGASIVEGARVRRVHGHGPIDVHTDAGDARAGQVVVATNMPILDRGGFFARLVPARSYSLAFRTPTPVVDGMYLSAGLPSRSLRDAVDAQGGALLLVGGNGHTTGRARSERARMDDLRSWTRDQFGDVEEVSAWSAQDYQPHHGLPYAGPLLPGRDDILFAGGFAKWGMTNGIAAGHVLTARITGEVPGWADAFSTWTSRELRGLPTAAKANAEVGVAMAAGWMRPLSGAEARTPPAEGEGRVGRAGLSAPVAVSTTDGATRRVSAVCTHLGGIVSWNDAERSWDCPLHGSRFDDDGAVLEGVATCGLTRRDA